MSKVKIGASLTAEAGGAGPRVYYSVYDRHDFLLGVVLWYEPWHRYVFEPSAAVFAADCLRDLAALCDRLTPAAEGPQP